jgi:hypothetical protein
MSHFRNHELFHRSSSNKVFIVIFILFFNYSWRKTKMRTTRGMQLNRSALQRIFVFSVLIGLMGASVMSTIGVVQAGGSRSEHTLYVGGSGPGNFTSIQSAINAAAAGDAVFVYDDSSPYHEQVMVGKPITLVGENKNTTVIDGGGTFIRNVFIATSGVTVKGFTLANTHYSMFWSGSIWLEWGLSDIVITSNIIVHHPEGMGISNYLVKQVMMNGAYDELVQQQELMKLEISQKQQVTPTPRTIIITDNTISGCDAGIALLDGYTSSEIYGNMIKDNSIGIYLDYYPTDTLVYHNNLMNNTFENAMDYSASTIWDNGWPDGGNYWSDYAGTDHRHGEFQTDSGKDGIGDTPYNIPDSVSVDYYPFMHPSGWIISPPNTPQTPNGHVIAPSTLNHAVYRLFTMTTDPQGYLVYYQWNWDDGTMSDWLGPRLSGSSVNVTHSWSQGVYLVKVRAKNTRDAESSWSEPLLVKIP